VSIKTYILISLLSIIFKLKKGKMSFKKGLVSLVLSSSFFLASGLSYAETVHYGSIKGAKSPAYVELSSIEEQSKYQAKMKDVKEGSVDYESLRTKRNESVSTSIETFAKEKGYDVVVEKDDPKIDNYVEITPGVITKMKELEKDV
jgi:Skp family chaperone for outer membrane proteins